MKKSNLSIALGLTATIGLTGCFDGSDSNTSQGATPNTSYSITAIDGYLNGAQVWLDLNANFQLDANEPSTFTGEGGKAQLDITGIDNPETYPLVVRSIKGKTVDEDTGNTVASDYVMSAPAGERDVTPLSTLVHVQLESGSAANKEEAVQKVADELGLDTEAVLGDYKESNNEKAAFGARSIVASGALPESPEGLETAAKDTDGNNELLDSVAIVNAKIKKIVEDDESILDEIVFNKEGNADVDSDKDGVADSDDAFPSDATEWLDTDNDDIGNNTDDDDDGDGVLDEDDQMPLDSTESQDSDSDGLGDNADPDDDNDGVLDIDDAFDFDPKESLDTDGDGIGNNADTDDDGDEVNDDEDVFPLDKNESIDTDGDGIGNNADTDDDDDGISDDQDAFPLDDKESLDTDNDGIGNNADNDDDGDGVEDKDDLDPIDPEVGLSDIAKAIEFFKSQSNFYSLWQEDHEDIVQLYLDTLTPNGDLAPLTQTQRVQSDGSLISISTGSDSDTQLTVNGWTAITEEFTFDFSNNQIEAYPIGYPNINYTATATYQDISGKALSSYDLDVDLLEESDAIYPEGSTAVTLNFIPKNDAYYLWVDWSPWIFNGNQDQSYTTLDELIVDTSVGATTEISSYYGPSIGWNVSVELVANNEAHFYTLDWEQNQQAIRVASATWSLESKNGEEFILFTVPQVAIDAWGDKFDQDSPHILFGVYDGQIHQGSHEKAGVAENDQSTFINAVAKDAVLGAVEVPVSTCSTGDNQDGTATESEFEDAVTACGGGIAMTTSAVENQNFYRVRNNGDTRDYFFNSDGTVDVAKNGEYAYTDDWSLNNGRIVITVPDSDFSWTWVLVEQSDSRWALKFYETETENGQAMQWIWSDTVELTDDSGSCKFQDNDSADLTSFKAELAAYSTCIGSPLTTDLLGLTLTRIKSNGETRGYQFNTDGTAINYRNGIPRARTWEYNAQQEMVMVYYDSEKTELAEYLVALSSNNTDITLATFAPDDSESWASTYTDLAFSQSIMGCSTGNTEWDEVNDIPVYGSYQDYLDAIENCQDGSHSSAAFSSEYFDRDISFTSSTNEEGEYETFLFNQDGTGSYRVKGIEDDESFAITWSVDNHTRLVDVTITTGDVIARDVLAIVDSNGIDFSIKGFSQGSDWDGITNANGGDIWSRTFTAGEPDNH